MKFAVVLGTIVIGFGCIALSGLWSTMFPASAVWTEEKAARSAEVKARLAYLAGVINSPRRTMHGGPDPASAKAEFDALQKENDQLNQEFDSAAERPQTVSTVLKWTGISLAALGIIGWYAVKQTE